MRRLGKCDGCRQRKVKCDEQKPSCGRCERGGHACSYLYPQGHGFAVVMQDPSRMTRYGRSIVASAVRPLDTTSSESEPSGPKTTLSQSSHHRDAHASAFASLQLKNGMIAEDGQGMYQTLGPMKLKSRRLAAKAEVHQRTGGKKFQTHLLRLRRHVSAIMPQPSSPELKLVALFVDLLQPRSNAYQPLYALGDWVATVPSRIGSSKVVTLAAEFFVNSSQVYDDGTHSNRIKALQIKHRALTELQLSVLKAQQYSTYDLLIATKLHYAAEILLGVESMHYAVHTLGLMDLLRSVVVSGADEDHIWNLIDNTYIDDISLCMTAGRTSVYESEFFLTSTHPAVLCASNLSVSQKTARSMMHIFIQFPRLIVGIRQAISAPQNTDVLVSAFSLAETLWQLSQATQLAEAISSSHSAIVNCVDGEVADIVPHALRFDYTQHMVTCTRFYSLQIGLCGCLDTLHRYFPEVYGISLLPDPDELHHMDLHAATQVAQVLLGLEEAASPLVFVRLHVPVSFSIGSWHRNMRYLSSLQYSPQALAPGDTDITKGIIEAKRMKRWLMSRYNAILRRLDITSVDEGAWIEALDAMAGDKIPAWIPTRVSFGSDQGEMVMRLEYSEHRATTPQEYFQRPRPATRVFNVRNPARFGPQHLREWILGGDVSTEEHE